MDELKIHELSLQFPHDKEMLIRFLNRNGLVFEEDIEAAYGIFTPEDELAGCGCCAGNLLKCFAVDESLRGQNALGSLISRLTENRFAAGYFRPHGGGEAADEFRANQFFPRQLRFHCGENLFPGGPGAVPEVHVADEEIAVRDAVAGTFLRERQAQRMFPVYLRVKMIERACPEAGLALALEAHYAFYHLFHSGICVPDFQAFAPFQDLSASEL